MGKVQKTNTLISRRRLHIRSRRFFLFKNNIFNFMHNTQKQLDEVAVILGCYEPAGESIELTERDLLGHTLITGGSGAGKTTRIIYPMLKQLIAHRSATPSLQQSLVIYDTKGDGEVRRFLEKACREAEREDDLIVISQDENSACIDIMSDLPNCMEAIDALAEILCSGCAPKTADSYWGTTLESMIKQALRLYAFSEEHLEYRAMFSFLTSYILDTPSTGTDVKNRLHKVKELAENTSVITAQQAAQLRATHWMWRSLAEKTKSIIQSMAVPLIDALNASATEGLLASGQPCRIENAIKCHKIVLVSLDAIRYSAEARVIGCVLKGQFYDTILARKSGGKHSPAGLFLDDWLLSATGGIGQRYSDVTALSIIRSRGGYVTAASQSLASLDLVIGTVARRAAFANFANLFFFRSRDPELDALAAAYFGQTSIRLNDYSSRSSSQNSEQVRLFRTEREVRVPAVPVGSLARLPLGECYAIIGAQIYDKPLCLVPEFPPGSEKGS